MLSIRMLKISDESLCGLLGLIFQSCFENGKFPSEWKKANVVPTYNKNDKQLATIVQSCNFQFVVRSLNALFITNFHFFQGNNLISPNQSGFKPGDSCTNQLLAITQEIYKSFDMSMDMKSEGSLSQYF